MSSQTRAPAADADAPVVTFEELRTEAGTVVRIADPENDDAWLLADYAVPVEA